MTTRLPKPPRPILLSGSAAVLAVTLLLAGCESATPVEVSGDGLAGAAYTGDAESTHDLIGPARGDEAGVAAVAAGWDAAWNAWDVDALAALFVEDAEFVNGRGQIEQGRTAIRATHQFLFAGPFAGSITESEVRRITFLTGTIAILDVTADLTGFAAPPPGVTPTAPGLMRTRFKILVAKRRGEWRIVQMQLTLVAAPPTI